MKAPEQVTEHTRLHCEVAVPSGIRYGRVFVRLRQPEPGVLDLLPARGIGDATHQIINVWGRPLLTHVADADPAVCGEILRNGCWEFAQSMMLLSLIRPGMTVIDAGAHIGYYSLLLAPTLGGGGQVYAFEPEYRNLLTLTANALLLRQLFPQAAPVNVFAAALAEEVGTGRLHVFDKNSAAHSLVHGADEAAAIKSVPVTSLDALSEAEGPAVLRRRVDLLKIDVGGTELAVLRGGQRTLPWDRPIVCLNCQPQLHSLETCLETVQWLTNCGYANFRLFSADAADPHQVLAENVAVWSAEEVLDQFRRKNITGQAALLAFPESKPVDASK